MQTVGDDEVAEFRAKAVDYLSTNRFIAIQQSLPETDPSKNIKLSPNDYLCIGIDMANPEGEVTIWERISQEVVVVITLEQLRDLLATMDKWKIPGLNDAPTTNQLNPAQ